VFPIEHIKQVEAILGVPIEFNGSDHPEVIKARMPSRREQKDVPEFKGKSGYTVAEMQKVFVVTEYRKVENEGGEIEIKEMKHEVPRENVDVMRDALLALDESRFKDGKIGCRRLAEKVMQLLEIDRFNRTESGTFDWEKFFGCRADYGHYYYYPLKVLEANFEVIHHKNGKITKLAVKEVLG